MEPGKISLTAILLFCFVTTLPAQKPQPLVTTLLAHPPGETIPIRILNDSGLRDYAKITLFWELRANGIVRQKGSLPSLPIPPHHPTIVRLPARISPNPTEELYLDLYYRYRRSPAVPGQKPLPGRLLAEEQFQLHPWTGSQLPIKPVGDLSFTDSAGSFTIQSPAARLAFDKQTGWLQTYEAGGLRLLADTPGTHFWLDSTDSRYGPSAAASTTWAAASQPHLQLFSTSTGSQLVIVRAEYTLPETSCLLHLSYTINAAGEMLVEQSLEADTSKKGEPLPCFGMYWQLPAGYDSVAVYGKTPSSLPAIYHIPVSPSREDGVRWWTITRPDGKGLKVTADSTLLTISTAPSVSRLIIDQPAAPYQLPYKNYRYAYKLSPVLPDVKKTIGK